MDVRPRTAPWGRQRFVPTTPPGNLFQVERGGGAACRALARRCRAGRDRDGARRALDGLEQAARGATNSCRFMIDASRSGSMLGEICDRLRAVLRAPHQPSVTFETASRTIVGLLATGVLALASGGATPAPDGGRIAPLRAV